MYIYTYLHLILTHHCYCVPSILDDLSCSFLLLSLGDSYITCHTERHPCVYGILYKLYTYKFTINNFRNSVINLPGTYGSLFFGYGLPSNRSSLRDQPFSGSKPGQLPATATTGGFPSEKFGEEIRWRRNR